MGINGLLQHLKACCKEKKLHEYRGQRAAVDTYAWLHKIIKGPSGLALVKGGKDKFKFVRDILKRIDKLKCCGVQPVLVFDGGPLPRKREEEQARRKRRQESYIKAKELLDTGDEEGYKKMAESIDISPDMAYHLIIELKKNNIEFIVAPYEADAQLAYLCRTGYVDFILTEDSDLLAFGAPKVLYKFDFINFIGQEVCLNNIKRIPQVQFNWFTHGMFLTTCILSGCDYLGQLSGIGIKKAQKIISRVSTFKRFIEEMSSESIPADYEENFMKAFLTFRYQRVYCPKRKMCVEVNERNFTMNVDELKEIDQSNTEWTNEVLNAEVLEYVKNHYHELDFDFLGPMLEDDIAREVAEGIISPITFEPYKIDDLGSLKYNGPGIINESMNRIPQPKIIKKTTKEKLDYQEQAMGMANFLNQKTEKRNLLAKPNYRPLKLAQQESYECFSIDSQSDNEQKSNGFLGQFAFKENKKDGKDSKDRKLMFKNDSDEQEDDDKSSEINSNISSDEKSNKQNSLNLDSFRFEKVQMKKSISLDDKDLHFNFNKQKVLINEKPMEPIVKLTPKGAKAPVLNRIDQAYEIQQTSPFKGLDFSQFLYKEDKKTKDISEKSSKDKQSSQEVGQLDIDSTEIKHTNGSTETDMYDKGQRSMETNDNSDDRNIFLELAKSIKPKFGENFFKNPYGFMTQ